MRLRSIRVCCFCAVISLNWANLEATPLQHPKRLVGAYQVDLDPLFKWWTKHEGSRPLSSWVHISGSIVGTNAAGWIVDAHVEGMDKTEGKARAEGANDLKIVLRTPPVEDLADFQTLSAKLAALNAQRASLTSQEGRDKQREQSVAAQQRSARGSRARLLSLEDKQLKQDENSAKAVQKPLDQQIQEVKSKLAVYGSTNRFTLDCFALDLHSDYDQMPLYEHGRILK